MLEIINILIVLVFMGGLLCLLGVILWFSFISPFLDRDDRKMLSSPALDGIDAICGFKPDKSLSKLYKRKVITKMEFYLVSPSGEEWGVGEFYPISKKYVKAKQKLHNISGLPIAGDLGKGAYFLSKNGQVKHLDHSLGGDAKLVAVDLESFLNFEVREI